MDTLTHIALGAIVGEALAGKKLGKKALLLGAVAQSLPDIDFIAALWLNPADNLLAHRGFTHSFIFIILITPILALLADRWKITNPMSLRKWIYFFGLQLLIHLLIDSLNAYGVGWLEPFNHFRFSFHVLFVADPVFSLPLGLAFVALIILRSNHRLRLPATRFGLIFGVLYISYAVSNKLIINQDLDTAYTEMNIEPERYFVTPTPLNTWLWCAIAEIDSGYQISYHSVFDSRPDTNFTFFYRNESLLESINDQELKNLLQFSNGYYTAEQWGDTLVFNDIRFGQMAGWSDPKAGFTFHYYLQRPEENKFVVQRGRFANWDFKTTQQFIERIKGN